MTATYRENLNNKVKFFHSTKVSKVLQEPVRMFLSGLLPLVAEIFKRPVITKARLFWGDDMTVVLPEAVSVIIYRYGYFEQELTSYILENVAPDMTFFDIGAHYGYFSLLASKIVGPNGQVHSFDPTPSTFEILASNLQSADNSVLQNIAVWSSEQTLTLNDYGLKYASLNTLLKARASEEHINQLDGNTYSVKANSIDNYCNINNIKPDFVKIDAENAELEILKGMKNIIKTAKPMITVEVGDDSISKEFSSKSLVEYLLSQGYEAYEHDRGKIVKHKLLDTYCYNNLLFMHPDK
jgi:FkbM family methyltransferase